MRKTILSMALMVLIGGADAFAQGSSSVSKNSGGRQAEAAAEGRSRRRSVIASRAPATCPARRT